MANDDPIQTDRNRNDTAAAAREWRRIPPSGDVLADGSPPWQKRRRRQRCASICRSGTIAFASAAGTVAALLAMRALVDHVAGIGHAAPPRHEKPAAPKPAAPKPTTLRPAKPHPRTHHGPPPRRRAHPAAGAKGMAGLLSGMSAGVGRLSANIAAAMDGFRGVAAQADSISDEFHRAADRVLSTLHLGERPGAGGWRTGDAERARENDRRRRHRL